MKQSIGDQGTNLVPQDTQERQPNVVQQQQSNASAPLTDRAKVIDQMRKWGLHCDGKDVYGFLERLNELQQAYDFTDQQVLHVFAELQRNDTQLWYRNAANDIRTLSELKKSLRAFYLRPSEQRNLDRQILARRQTPNEPIRTFVTDSLTLMRRHGVFNLEQQLHILYYSVKTEYRLYLKRRELTSINDLIHSEQDLDETQQQVSRTRSQPIPAPPSGGIMTVTAYNRRDCGRRCKQRGHSRYNCKNQPKKFSHCGKDDVLSRDCNCHKQANYSRTGPNNNKDRPKPNTKTDTSSKYE